MIRRSGRRQPVGTTSIDLSKGRNSTMNAAERIARAEEELALVFEEIDTREIRLTRKVLDAFREHGVASRHFAPTNG